MPKRARLAGIRRLMFESSTTNLPRSCEREARQLGGLLPACLGAGRSAGVAEPALVVYSLSSCSLLVRVDADN